MKTLPFLILFLTAAMLTGCYTMRSSQGGSQLNSVSKRLIKQSVILLLPGFKIELVHEGRLLQNGREQESHFTTGSFSNNVNPI